MTRRTTREILAEEADRDLHNAITTARGIDTVLELCFPGLYGREQ